MGSNTSGFQNETDLISALSNKLYAELNDNLKKFISFLFPQVNNNDKIKCYSGMVGQKPDIIIEINNKRKNVSIKKGSGNSVHQEDIDLFMDFLTTLDISEEAKIELLKYHWADGTTDGSGKIRVSSAEYKAEHQKEIDLINSELNKREALTKLITRVLFKGKFADEDYFLTFLLSFRDKAEILEPEYLRERICKFCDEIRCVYEKMV